MLGSQYYLVFDSVHARKIFYAMGYLTIILAIVFHSQFLRPFRNKSLTFSILFLALSFIVWAMFFKQESPFHDVYNGYGTSGRILLMFGILTFIYSNAKPHSKPFLLDLVFIIGGLAANLYAIYQYNQLHLARIELSFDRATMAAYVLTVLDILMLHAVLNHHGWKRYALFVLAICFSFSAIVFSGTRAAIISYPVLCLVLSFTHREVNKTHLIKLIGCFIALCIAIGFIFKQPLQQRINALIYDISVFQAQNSKTSVGARFAMVDAGFQAGLQAPLGQSAERRGSEIQEITKKNVALTGADTFLNVHMHNELIDNFSLRGVVGVIAVLMLYASLIWCSWKNRNPALFVITLSMMIYGLSDVIFFSREGTLTYVISILTAMTFLNIQSLPSSPLTGNDRR
ncbi:O-antigen ligase family protein [Buttiauxella warmboldiae]|uniref:O-antigen ligase family protein n=2 Tax=Buttiauxella warmboldiae TaxID=82993 RepID=A0A3N5DRC6_9ENTR|nr:O-antigen ligase family protein [Buttiauxella warmboldiae]